MATETKWTYDDLLLLDDGKRYEIIDGELLVDAAPNLRHQTIVGRIFRAVSDWLDTHPIGQVWGSPVDVVFSEIEVVEPDLTYVSNERAGILNRTNIRGAPDLVVEVLSGSTRRRDEITKRKLYETRGVAEYWIVDPDIDVIKIYHGGTRIAELSLEHGDTLTTPLLPGLDIPLAKIFA